jgi:hypothetical protein
MHTQTSHGGVQGIGGIINHVAGISIKQKRRGLSRVPKHNESLLLVRDVLQLLLGMQASNVMPHIDKLIQLPACQYKVTIPAQALLTCFKMSSGVLLLGTNTSWWSGYGLSVPM